METLQATSFYFCVLNIFCPRHQQEIGGRYIATRLQRPRTARRFSVGFDLLYMKGTPHALVICARAESHLFMNLYVRWHLLLMRFWASITNINRCSKVGGNLKNVAISLLAKDVQRSSATTCYFKCFYTDAFYRKHVAISVGVFIYCTSSHYITSCF